MNFHQVDVLCMGIIVTCLLAACFYLYLGSQQLMSDNYNLASAYFSRQNELLSVCKIDYNEYEKQLMVNYAIAINGMFNDSRYNYLHETKQSNYYDYNFLNDLKTS